MNKLSLAALIILTSTAANAADLTEQSPVATEEGVEVKLSEVDAVIVTPVFPPAISYEKANEIAIQSVKDSLQVVGTSLSVKEGENFVYKVEVYAGGVITEVEIDATTGNAAQIEISE